MIVFQSFTLNVQIKHSKNIFILPALIDPGADANIIDHDTATKLKLPMQPLQHPPKISSIDGGPIGTGTIPPPRIHLLSGNHNHQAPDHPGTPLDASP